MAVIEQETVTEVETPIVTTRDVLHRAAYLFEEGIVEWAQAPCCDHTLGRQCIMGAISQALGHDDAFCPPESFARSLGFRNSFAGWDWNDEPGRTKAEVVAKLREAAEAA